MLVVPRAGMRLQQQNPPQVAPPEVHRSLQVGMAIDCTQVGPGARMATICMNHQRVTYLTLLDLSAAFDTI